MGESAPSRMGSCSLVHHSETLTSFPEKFFPTRERMAGLLAWWVGVRASRSCALGAAAGGGGGGHKDDTGWIHPTTPHRIPPLCFPPNRPPQPQRPDLGVGCCSTTHLAAGGIAPSESTSYASATRANIVAASVDASLSGWYFSASLRYLQGWDAKREEPSGPQFSKSCWVSCILSKRKGNGARLFDEGCACAVGVRSVRFIPGAERREGERVLMTAGARTIS